MSDPRKRILAALNELFDMPVASRFGYESAVMDAIAIVERELPNTDRLAELEAENAELCRDRERLEWLALNNCRVWLQDGWYDIHDNGGTCIVFMADNWRDAIDEAMEVSDE